MSLERLREMNRQNKSEKERTVRRSSSIKKSNSFKIKRMGNIIVCDCCGQGHEPGKNHLYDYPDNVDDALLCGICVQPLVDPVDTPCSHTFCYVCLKSQLRMSKTCPADKQAIKDRDIKPSSLLVRKILDKLTVVCPNNAYCDQTMARSSLETHLKYHCPGSYTTCPRDESGCDYIGPRCQLEEHLWICSFGQDIDRSTGMRLSVLEGQRTTIEIPKGTSDLGLGISWCEELGGFTIDEIFAEGNVFRDGRLCIGDRILEINGNDVTQKSLAQVTLAMSTPVPLMKLTMYRDVIEGPPEPELVELQREDNASPLGIQIRTSRNRPGIFVHYLVPGSRAEENGQMLPGDRILEANGCDMRHASVDEAANYMTKVPGNLKLLVHHHRRQPSDCARPPHNHGHTLNPQPIYDEIVAPSGFRIGEPKCVIVRKDPDEVFGMNVAGGLGCQSGDLPVFISALRPDSAVAKGGKVQRGDILLSINDIDLSGKSHSDVIQIIKSVMSATTVKMELIQGDEMDGGLSPDWVQWMKKYESGREPSPVEYNVTLLRSGTESLGFSIVGGAHSARGNSPVFIRNLAPNSIAAEDGRLKSGDEILRINGAAVGHMSTNRVVQVIKNTVGNVTLTVISHGSSSGYGDY